MTDDDDDDPAESREPIINPDIVALLSQVDVTTMIVGMEAATDHDPLPKGVRVAPPEEWRLKKSGEPLTDEQIELVKGNTPAEWLAASAIRRSEAKAESEMAEALSDLNTSHAVLFGDMVESVKGALILADLSDADIEHFMAENPARKEEVELVVRTRYNFMEGEDDLFRQDPLTPEEQELHDTLPGIPYRVLALYEQAAYRKENGLGFNRWIRYLRGRGILVSGDALELLQEIWKEAVLGTVVKKSVPFNEANADQLEQAADTWDDSISAEDNALVSNVKRGLARFMRHKGFTRVDQTGDLLGEVGPKFELLGSLDDDEVRSERGQKLLAEIDSDLEHYQEGDS